MKISYTKYGDYYLPDLTVPNKKYNIGRFGMMHLKYIKQYRPGFYTSMKITGKLMDYIQEIDSSAQEMYDDIMRIKRRSRQQNMKNCRISFIIQPTTAISHIPHSNNSKI